MSAPVNGHDAPDVRVWIPAARVWRDRYQVTSMTGYRWEHDPRLDFPKPIRIGRFKYYRIAELDAWDVRQAERSAAMLEQALRDRAARAASATPDAELRQPPPGRSPRGAGARREIATGAAQ